MKVAIGSDHTGIQLKKVIIDHFKNIEFVDVGAYNEESCDYPDFISKVGIKVQNNEVVSGIAICGTGIGAMIVANKIKGIRAALCLNSYMAEMAKRHNNANVLALGSRVIGSGIAIRIVEKWFNSTFDGGRHQKRIDKISLMEEGQGLGTGVK